MKIAHIVCTYPPYFGGMGNVVFQMATELNRRGHDVQVFTPDYYDANEVRSANAPESGEHAAKLQEQIDFARRLRPSFSYGNAARMPQLLEELNAFDLVHLHYPFFGTANIVRRFKQQHPEKPLVVTYHMDNRAAGWKGLIFSLYAKFWLPKILSAADLLIGSSYDYIAVSDAVDSYRTNHKKWRAIPFGVDIERFQPREKTLSLLSNHGLLSSVPTILFVGGMDEAHYFKGVPVLLKAFLLLKKRGIPFQGLLVGDGSQRSSFEMTAEAYGLLGQVKFAGKVTDELLPRYYNLADVLALPSTTAGEAFGMVLLEAMASGVPVVASDLPGVRSVASQGGEVVPPNNPVALADMLELLLSSEKDRGEYAIQARQAVQSTYNWNSIGDSLEEVYFSLLNK